MEETTLAMEEMKLVMAEALSTMEDRGVEPAAPPAGQAEGKRHK
jgi:hypothetical protein